jgi:hypothetical protein
MLNFEPQHFFGPLIAAGFVLFFMYRRVRRNFGKQKLNPGYLIFRMVLLCMVGLLLLIPTFFSTELAVVTIIGAAIGVGLALWAAKHTRFLREDGVLYYLPHSYTGMVVTALFVGRIAYKVFVNAQPHTVVTTDWNPGMGDLSFLNAFVHNPWTRLVYFILVGYYVYYYWFVLHESKHLKPEDMEGVPADKPGGNI